MFQISHGFNLKFETFIQFYNRHLTSSTTASNNPQIMLLVANALPSTSNAGPDVLLEVVRG